MKSTNKFFVYSILVIAIGLLAYCRSDVKTKTANPDDITNPENGYFHIPNALGLPHVQDIPGYQNMDSLVAYLQNAADTFSWKSFISMHWPANPDGSADSTKTLSAESAFTVFEHWMPSTELYVDSGQIPQTWEYGMENDFPINSGSVADLRIIPKLKSMDKTNAHNLPLVDVNGKYTMFQIFYNKQAYEYVFNAKLYSKEGQKEFATNWPSVTQGLKVDTNGTPMGIENMYSRAYFPVGNNFDSTFNGSGADSTTTYKFIENPGAVILKAGWRILTSKDDTSRFYTRRVALRGGKEIHIGLVAVHIIHKVSEVTQWVWSTFEQIDNAPQMGENGQPIIDKSIRYSYLDPNNYDSTMINKPTDRQLFYSSKKRTPAQVARVTRIAPSTEKINSYFINSIAKYEPESVWQYYKLVGTQWPLDPSLFTYGSKYQPRILANAALETFNQKTSTCMGCHSQARFLQGDGSEGYNADFIFGLSNVK
ncbi:MAG: hypothetical protein KJP21_06485 [Bacteroidia bacterium]|nr:hypothetical protein [Bacteroidia bacterium]NNJ55174.1 hypothetical protein [Bacteroidia bacterium]